MAELYDDEIEKYLDAKLKEWARWDYLDFSHKNIRVEVDYGSTRVISVERIKEWINQRG